MLLELNNEYATVVDEVSTGDCDSYVDTGSYILNALCVWEHFW